jgi:hypothetical protein
VPDIVWASEGYMIHKLKYLVDDFPVAAGAPPLKQVEADTYYDFLAGYADTLTIPAELTRLLDAFNGLDGDDRERFLRACFWYHTASAVWDYSQSLYLTSLVNAIECLASVGPQRTTPEGPSKLFLAFMRRFAPLRPRLGDLVKTGGPSALFKSLMRSFAPGGPSGALLTRIYDTRSKITHGERLLYLDQSSPSVRLDQTSARDREVGDSASVLCRGALINWLWSHDPAVTGPLLTKGLSRTKPARPGTKSSFTIITPGSK